MTLATCHISGCPNDGIGVLTDATACDGCGIDYTDRAPTAPYDPDGGDQDG